MYLNSGQVCVMIMLNTGQKYQRSVKMVEVIIFIVLLISMFVLMVTEIIWGISWSLKKRKKVSSSKNQVRLKRNSILLIVTIILMGGLMLYSQITVSTPKIKEENGKVMENSIAKLESVDLNTRSEWISIREQKKSSSSFFGRWSRWFANGGS